MISSVPIIIALLDFEIFAIPFLILGSILELIALTCIIYCLFNTRNLPVFDTLNGRFYPQGRRHAESAVSTKDIDHLQILEMEMSPGFCYELNAVMKDGNRRHIMAHGGRQNFMKDAKQLAQNLALSIKDEQGEPYVDIPGKHEGPLVPGGVSFQSMRLVFRQDSITVKATWRLHLGYILFMAIGTGIFCMGLFSSDGLFWPALIMGALFAGIALLGSLTMILKKTFPLFDMVDGMFYPKGFTRDGSGISLKQLDHLEILKERVYNKNGSYDSYELNVALKDGSRYNIMDHGADKLLLADAKQLAEKLSLQLVDAQSGLPVTEPLDEKHKTNSASTTSAKETIGGVIFLVFFGLMFFVAGSFAAWMLCIKPLSGVIASGGWTPTPARIVSSHLDSSRGSKGGSTYRVNIHYEYDVNGAHYTSNRYDFFRSDMSSNVGVGTMREIVSDMTEGKEVTCLVNPANPTEAVISRAIPWFNALFMLFPLPFLFIGGMTIFTAIKSLFIYKDKS
ncbi:MAG: DUF3592 domain-containing protein [Victivallales bacterium]|nr:DUF3592 domain-containing protein [Victivallales bacterium]